MSSFEITTILAMHDTSNFTGQKLLHPFKMKKVEEEYSFKNKRKQTITKTKTGNVYDNTYIDGNVQTEIENATRFEIKHDGSCGYIQYNPEDNTYTPYSRRDLKKGASGEFPTPSTEWIPCEAKPLIPESTHWPHFVKCKEDSSLYKWELEAFDQALNSNKLNVNKSFTCEYMGKKKNFCLSDPIDLNCAIVPHSSYQIDIPNKYRNYDGFLKVFLEVPYIEGLVIYGPTRTFKIRRDMYCSDGTRLKWPNSDSIMKLSEKVMLV